MRIKIIAGNIPGGEISKVLGEYESIQMTSDELRDNNDNTILHYFHPERCWFDVEGNGWYNWTIEACDEI